MQKPLIRLKIFYGFDKNKVININAIPEVISKSILFTLNKIWLGQCFITGDFGFSWRRVDKDI